MQNDRPPEARPLSEETGSPAGPAPDAPKKPRELGGPPGPEPTRYGDWEKAGRCIDF